MLLSSLMLILAGQCSFKAILLSLRRNPTAQLARPGLGRAVMGRAQDMGQQATVPDHGQEPMLMHLAPNAPGQTTAGAQRAPRMPRQRHAFLICLWESSLIVWDLYDRF